MFLAFINELAASDLKKGLAALNGKILDLGLSKISFRGIFLFLPTPGSSNLAGPYPNPVSNLAGQS